MTIREMQKEIHRLKQFLDTCDIDGTGEYIPIWEPSEELDAINEATDRLAELKKNLAAALDALEDTHHHYGVCPSCGEACQPEYVNANDMSLEYVVCCDCEIIWYLHHEDETDKRDGTEPWRTYRISEIESFDTFGAVPYDCVKKRQS